jgi:hypothetical protein
MANFKRYVRIQQQMFMFGIVALDVHRTGGH